VAGQTAEIIKGVTENFNEKEIKAKLGELEKLLINVAITETSKRMQNVGKY